MYGQLAVDYERQFGKHKFKASVLGDTRNTLTNWDLPEYPSNIIGDVSYDYAERYFAQVALSESYYNRYAPGRRWGTFYAFGLGWDISKENFMENCEWLNQLKIRGVYGKTGNGMNNAGYYTYYQTYSSGGDDYRLGTNLGQSSGSFTEKDKLANLYQTWEKGNKLNIGVDIALFNNKLQVTADYFNDKYYDLLQARGKSIELIGQNYPDENIAKERWYGGEFSITYQDHVGDFNYYASANWSCEQSKVLYKDEQKVPYEYLRTTGKPKGAIFGLVAEGFFTSQDEITKSPVIEGFNNIQPGDIKYKDQNNDGVINIKDGRHPVVEKMLNNDMFITNDTYLNNHESRISIITGPNMAGKSTYMRQTALIVLMAQVGSFVPAASADIGICDRIFTRVGASDDLASGQSTFMVEMSEVANILRNATKNSLLILDEIGRGTSTYDGLAIAWAVVEYISNSELLGAKTLFATHYHELTELEGKLSAVNNYCIAVKEDGDDIVFLRKIVKGGADRSYGIQVAKLAGVPPELMRYAISLLIRT